MIRNGQNCLRYQQHLKPWTRIEYCCRIFISHRHKSSQRKRDYYEILGVSRLANKKAIKEAYIAKSKKLHPDRLPSTSNKADAHEKFIELQEAYEVLRKRGSRIEYDSISRRQHSSPTRKPRSSTADHGDSARRDHPGDHADANIGAEHQRVEVKPEETPVETVVLVWSRRVSIIIILSLLLVGYFKSKKRKNSNKDEPAEEKTS